MVSSEQNTELCTFHVPGVLVRYHSECGTFCIYTQLQIKKTSLNLQPKQILAESKFEVDSKQLCNICTRLLFLSNICNMQKNQTNKKMNAYKNKRIESCFAIFQSLAMLIWVANQNYISKKITCWTIINCRNKHKVLDCLKSM